jgi:tRNA dimethylallyltransferase
MIYIIHMQTQKRKIIAIVGPTASGKTNIGVKLAKEFNGEIVSADSRQVYRGLDIGTGKEGEPTEGRQLSNVNDQLSTNGQLNNSSIKNLNDHCNLTLDHLRKSIRRIDGIPQWMIDVAEPEEKMTLFDYLPLARAAIEDIFSRGKIPIIVGGTGLYIQGIVEGFELKSISNCSNYSNCSKQIPNSNTKNDKTDGHSEGTEESPTNVGKISDKLRDPSSSIQDDKQKTGYDKNNYSREQLDNLTIEQLNNILREIHLEKYETIDHKNRHRLIRAIELEQEGLVAVKMKPDFEVLQIGVDVPRKELHERIDERVDERFEAGMLEEVERLIKSGVGTDWLIGLGLEYREITQYILEERSKNKEVSEENKNHDSSFIIHNSEFQAMSQRLKFRIHQFARRQMTWFRRFPEIQWLSKYEEMQRFAKIFLEH